ncbi:hypothetical protein MASR1M101_36570 [Gemmatimonas sp.]
MRKSAISPNKSRLPLSAGSGRGRSTGPALSRRAAGGWAAGAVRVTVSGRGGWDCATACQGLAMPAATTIVVRKTACNSLRTDLRFWGTTGIPAGRVPEGPRYGLEQ